MTIQKMAHHMFPAAIRDIGTGLYHLAKRDATEEQCQKLMAGIIRVSAAAAFVFSIFALKALLPATIAAIIGISLTFSMMAADCETATLTTFSLGGLTTARTISSLATATFSQAIFPVLDGLFSAGLCWFSSRIPRDIKMNLSNSFYFHQLFTDKIDNLASKWGTSLYRAACRIQISSRVPN